MIKERKTQNFGHIIRGERYGLLNQLLQGKIEGKRITGRRKISWMKSLREWTDLSSVEKQICATENQVIEARMITTHKNLLKHEKKMR